jgi:hypothetical protein
MSDALSAVLRDALRGSYVEGYLLAVQHARERLKVAGIVGCDAVLDGLLAIPAAVETQAAIDKATGAAC